MNRIPWTLDQIDEMLPKLRERLAEAGASQAEEVRGLPPMTSEECREYLWRLIEAAKQRPLTQRECFLHGQLLSNLEMAVKAEMLGRKGRYFVIDENQIAELLKRDERAGG